MLLKRLPEAISLSKEKNRKHQYACEQYRNLFVENEPSKEEKNRNHQYAHKRYRNLSEEGKDKKHQYAQKQHRNLSRNI